MSNLTPILIVDDNQINRQYFSMSLKKTYHNVDVAQSGEQAIQKAKKRNYSLILMDIRMPEMDGYETTEQIRQLNNHQETTIIATSAENINAQQNEIFDDFIAKPISPKQLQKIVNKYTLDKKIDSTVFNQKKALKYAYNDEAIMQKLIVMFIQELPIQLDELDQTMVNNNTATCLEILHKLRGSCVTCGAENLNKECEKLSSAIKSDMKNDSYSTDDLHKAAQKFIQLF